MISNVTALPLADTPTLRERLSLPPLAVRDAHLRRPQAQAAGWTDLDVRAVDTARVLAADAVQRVGNGHPGTAMSLAPVAYLLYQNVMRHDQILSVGQPFHDAAFIAGRNGTLLAGRRRKVVAKA